MSRSVIINGKNIQGFIKSIVAGSIVGAIVTTALLMLSALIISKVSIPLRLTPYISIGCVVIGLAIGSFLSGRINGEKGIIIGLVVTVIFIAVLFIIGLLTSGIMLNVSGSVKLGVLTLTGIIGGILGVNKNPEQFVTPQSSRH